MNWRSWLLALVTVGFLGLVNFSCDPGIGPRRPPQPPGFELERYFGWPSCYRAELWDSDDKKMNDRGRGDFHWYDPSSEMNFRKREIGWVPAAVDVVFALLAVIGAIIVGEAFARAELGRRAGILLVAVVVNLIGLYLVSDKVGVYL